MALGLAFIYVPLAVVVINSFNADTDFAWPPQASRRSGGGRAWDNPGVRDACWTSVSVGPGRDRDRHGARHAAGVRAQRYGSSAATRVAAGRPADRPARHRHGLALRQGVPRRSSASELLDLDARDRARDVLHRRRLQQRDRAAAPARHARSRRRRWTSARHVHDVPPGHLPAAAVPSSPAGCWRSGCRSTRSSSPCSPPPGRHDAADLDLPEPVPVRTRRRRQRGRRCADILSIVPIYISSAALRRLHRGRPHLAGRRVSASRRRCRPCRGPALGWPASPSCKGCCYA